MATVWRGERDWSGSMEGFSLHRNYKLATLVEAEPGDGPANVMQAAGLPYPGDMWLVGDDIDIWAFFTGERSAKRHDTPAGKSGRWWIVEDTFTTKPPDRNRQRCSEFKIEDPLLEPPKVSGDFTLYHEEATHDRFGAAIKNSAHEQIRGKEVEFENHRMSVNIEMNFPTFDWVLIAASMFNTVNHYPLWGMPPRCVKLNKSPWEEKFYGGCYRYYTLKFQFDFQWNTFDRVILDEGTKVLRGHWGTTAGTGTGLDNDSLWILDPINGMEPNNSNPQHFIRALDFQGNPAKILLDGKGQPASAVGIRIIDPGVSVDTLGFRITFFTQGSHGYDVGDEISVIGVSPGYYNDDYIITSVGFPNQITVVPPLEQAIMPVPPPWKTGGTVYRKGRGQGYQYIQRYPESDFLLLGIPAVLGV